MNYRRKSLYLEKHLPKGWEHEVCITETLFGPDLISITVWNDELKLRQRWTSESDEGDCCCSPTDEVFAGYKDPDDDDYEFPSNVAELVEMMFEPLVNVERSL